MPVNKYYWEYSFDLLTDNVKKYYGKYYTNAWDEIGDYLIKNGFDNKDDKQGSCYFTSKMMTSQRAMAIIRKMFISLPWITLCLRLDSLTVRQETVFSNIDFANYLNNDKEHKNRLDKYYKDLGIENPIKE